MSAFISTQSCTVLNVRSNFTSLMNFSQYLVYFLEISSDGMHAQASSIWLV